MKVYFNKKEIEDLTSYNIVTNGSDTTVTLGLSVIDYHKVDEDVSDKATIEFIITDKLKVKPISGIISEKKLSGSTSYNKLPTILITILCAKTKWKIQETK